MPPPRDDYIGGVSSPALARLGLLTGRVPQYAPYARRFLSELEGSYGPSETVLPQIQKYATRAAEGGTDAERLAGERRVKERFGAAVAGPTGRGVAAGRYSPGLVSRLGALEATRTLAPAQAQLEGDLARTRAEGLRTGLRALTSVFPSQAAAEERRRANYGQFLGGLIREPRHSTPAGGTSRGGFGFRGGSA